MQAWTSHREAVQGRPDSEHSQALLRVVIVALLLVNTAWVDAHDPGRGGYLWAINVGSVLLSVLLLVRIGRRPHASPRRRVAGAVHDNTAITLWLYLSGPLGALALFVYPFITVGNGFRYGVRYLAWSGGLGALGIGVLVTSAPAWAPHATVGAGVLLSHVVVTAYTGTLLGQLHRTKQELERVASCDSLTGLPNRRLFMERLSGLVAQPGRSALACLYLDLDGFKAVNDRYGHEVGDQLLTVVGHEIGSCLRGTDMLARLGGDEFTVVLQGPATADEARQVADRIITAVERIEQVDGHPVSVSISVGVSFLPASDLGRLVRSEELVQVADEAMYAAKRAGKGCHRFVQLASAAA